MRITRYYAHVINTLMFSSFVFFMSVNLFLAGTNIDCVTK